MPKVVNPDLKQVEKLGRFQCTYEELAAWFEVNKRTVIRWMENEAFQSAFEKGKAQGRISLRQAQVQTALKGNPTMLIWMGKQLLGQKDVIHQEVSGELNTTEGAREKLLTKLSTLAETSADGASSPRPN
jgi:hypothetical protein